MAIERVQKILASAGVASRRDCEDLIKHGKVKVNGEKIQLGDKADITKDVITVSGKQVKLEQKEYFLLHKPAGYITTVEDPQGRKTVLELVQSAARLYPVGRLDYDTEGLLILTNDGDFANLLMHPRYLVQKEYEVTLEKPLREDTIERIAAGPRVDGRPVTVTILGAYKNTITIRIHEGRKHIVKRIFSLFGLRVTKLVRTAIGPLRIAGLGLGKVRRLSALEVETLRKSANPPKTQ